MRVGRLGSVLLGLGVVVGVVASVGLLVGFEPASLPPVLLNIAAYKLAFVAALGLMAVGAMFARMARRGDPVSSPAPLGATRTAELGGGQPAMTSHSEKREPLSVRNDATSGKER